MANFKEVKHSYGKIFWYQFPNKEKWISQNKIEKERIVKFFPNKYRPVVVVSKRIRPFEPILVCPISSSKKQDRDALYCQISIELTENVYTNFVICSSIISVDHKLLQNHFAPKTNKPVFLSDDDMQEVMKQINIKFYS